MDFDNISFEQVQQIERDALKGFADNGHSLISPSGYHSWKSCLGYVQGIHASRSKSSDTLATVEGTCGHFVLEICLTLLILPSQINDVSTIIPDNIKLDIKNWNKSICSKEDCPLEVKELCARLTMCLLNRCINHSFIVEITKVTTPIFNLVNNGYFLIAEAKVSLFQFFWHNASNGTSDVVLYNPTLNHLIIADLKYGAGVEVMVKNNGQLLIYCLGAISMLLEQGYPVNAWNISIVVCQPRINNRYWDEWTTSYSAMLDFAKVARAKSVRALYAISNPSFVSESDYVPSTSACMFCGHKLYCKPKLDYISGELSDALQNAGIVINNRLPVIPNNEHISDYAKKISTKEIEEIFKITPFFVAILGDIEKELKKRLLANDPSIKNVKLVQGRNKRTFNMTNEELESMLKYLGIYQESLIKKLPSVAQFENLQIDSAKKEQLLSHVLKIKGLPVMALISDNRKSLQDQALEDNKKILADNGIILSGN